MLGPKTLVHWSPTLGALLRKYNIWVTFVGLFIVASIISPSFLSFQNIINIFLQNSIIGILAIGQTLVILTAGIDLSVGATVALTTMVSALMVRHGILLATVCGLASGFVAGLVNGVLVTKGKLAPFIVTLATMGITGGIAAVLTEGTHVPTDAFHFIAIIYIGRVPLMIFVWILLTFLFYYLLKHRRMFRHMYAVGGDEQTAVLSGIKVNNVKLLAYVISGLLASLGGIFYLARLSFGNYTAGPTYNLDSIAAVVIGGTSLFGGKGGLVGTFLGVLVLGILENLINLLNISMYAQSTVKGMILIAIIFANVYQQRK